jgi:hypothetical protein
MTTFPNTAPAALAAAEAAREVATAKMGAALAKARSRFEAARQALEAERAAKKGREVELAGLSCSDVDPVAVRKFRQDLETLEIVIANHAQRVASAKAELTASEAAVADAKAALAEGVSQLDRPIPDSAEDMVRLRDAAKEADGKLAKARAELARVEETQAPPLAAFAAWKTTGTDEAASLRIIRNRAIAREKIADASAEVDRWDEAAVALHRRVEALENDQARRQRAATFSAELRRLESLRPKVKAAFDVYLQTADLMAQLVVTCAAWVSAAQSRVDHLAGDGASTVPQLMSDPTFADSLWVPSLKKGYFVCSNHWLNRNRGWDERHDILRPLTASLAAKNVVFQDVYRQAFEAIAGEYERLANGLVDCLSIAAEWCA